MATFFFASSITVTSGDNLVTVQDGDDVQMIREGSWLQVGDNPLVEVKRTFISTGGVPTIELARDWPYSSDSGRVALAAPTAADLDELTRKVRQLIDRSQDITDNVLGSFEELYTSTDSEITITVGDDEIVVVPWGFVKEQVEQQLDTWNLTIINTDPRRKAVEDASGGRNTVVYDAQGNPNVMVVIPRFNVEDLGLSGLDLGTGTHPAFITDGVARSEILVAKYLASSASGGTAVVGGVQPRVSVDFDTAKGFCTQKGDNWHLMSIHEWAAIALWSLANSTVPRGNTGFGRSHEKNWETAPRADGRAPGDTAGTGRTDTGKGTAGWGHDHTDFGIQDLVGNVWEWIDQMKLQDGRIITTLDNNPSVAEANWTPHEAYYDSTSETGGNPILNSSVTNRMGDIGDNSNGISNAIDFRNLTQDPSYTPAQLLRRLLLETATDETVGGRLFTRNYGERFPRRGGNWASGDGAGLGALSLNNSRLYSVSSVGFRPAFFV